MAGSTREAAVSNPVPGVAMDMAGIPFREPLVPARFLRRLNRFAALVRVEKRLPRGSAGSERPSSL